jgi:DNA-binding transcriptional regulator GbsR (MarR family)
VQDRDRQWFVEQVGLASEADGFTRIAGRLFGYLLLSERARSLDELAETLGVSKASVSTDARRLHERGVLERVAKAGDRRDYYQIAPDFFARLMDYRVARWQRMHRLTDEARARMRVLSPAVRERFDYMDSVSEFVVEVIETMKAEWAARRAASRRRPTRRSGTTG